MSENSLIVNNEDGGLVSINLHIGILQYGWGWLNSYIQKLILQQRIVHYVLT